MPEGAVLVVDVLGTAGIIKLMFDIRNFDLFGHFGARGVLVCSALVSN